MKRFARYLHALAPIDDNLQSFGPSEKHMLIPNTSLGLDKIDLKILGVLQREGRITKAKLAEMVNLSQTPCGTRIARMEDAGLIRGYHADIDLHKLAHLTRFLVTMTIVNDLPDVARRFEASLLVVESVEGKTAWEQIGPRLYEQVTGAREGGAVSPAGVLRPAGRSAPVVLLRALPDLSPRQAMTLGVRRSYLPS